MPVKFASQVMTMLDYAFDIHYEISPSAAVTDEIVGPVLVIPESTMNDPQDRTVVFRL
jgi:hypothetical protein